MSLNSNQSAKDIIKNAKPYESEEEWVDDCQTLEVFARGLVTLKKELDEGKYNNM